MVLKESIWIRTTPEEIFKFFAALENNYTRWHPDHLRFKWIEGRGVKEGVIFKFEEKIRSKLLKKRAAYTRVVDGQYIEFAPTTRFLRLFLPRMIFRIAPEGDGCRFGQEIHIRIGPLGKWLKRKEFDAVKQHMKDECENLKKLAERLPEQDTRSF
jgi:hypothetical protein